jgi:hypothetical protein
MVTGVVEISGSTSSYALREKKEEEGVARLFGRGGALGRRPWEPWVVRLAWVASPLPSPSPSLYIGGTS